MPLLLLLQLLQLLLLLALLTLHSKRHSHANCMDMSDARAAAAAAVERLSRVLAPPTCWDSLRFAAVCSSARWARLIGALVAAAAVVACACTCNKGVELCVRRPDRGTQIH